MSDLTTFPDARIATASEIRARKNLAVQFVRFVVLNLKMIVMVTKGHH